MATYSNLGIKLITTGDEAGVWGTSTNDNFSLFDATIVGYSNITLTGPGTTGSPNSLLVADGPLTGPNDPRKRVIEFTGSPGAASYVRVDPNDFVGYWFIRNSLSGGHSIFLFQGNYDAARDYEIPNGTDVVIRCTGGGTVSYVYNVLENLRVNSLSVAAISGISANFNMGGFKITNLGYPSASTDAASKAYVDAAGSIVYVSGNQILFRASAAGTGAIPAGWSIAAQDNKALRIVSGTPSSGGAVNFTSTFNTAVASTSAGSHAHTGTTDLNTSFLKATVQNVSDYAQGSHSHTFTTGAAGAHTHNTTIPNILYYDFNVIQKT